MGLPEDARKSESQGRMGSNGVNGGLPENLMNGVNEEVETSDGWDVHKRDRGESDEQQKLQHF